MKTTSLVLFTFTILAASCAIAASSGQLRTDIEYGKAAGQSLKLDAFVPPGHGPFPICIVVHGGGWGSGDKTKDIDTLLHGLSQARYVWFSINYRLAPQYPWPACYEDVKTAVHWVKTHAKEYNGDSHEIALVGYSAGGELVCLTACQADSSVQVNAVVGAAAPTDIVADTQRRGGLSKSLTALFGTKTIDDHVRKLLHNMSAIDFVHAGLPPFLLIHGTADKTVLYSQDVAFQAALKKYGVPCDLIPIPGAPHNISQWITIDHTYTTKMVDWLNKTLKAKTETHDGRPSS